MKKLVSLILVCILSLCVFASCNSNSGGTSSDFQPAPPDRPSDSILSGNIPSEPQTSETEGTTGEKTDGEKTDIPESLDDNANTLSVSFLEGTDNCWVFDGQTLAFSNLTADTACSVSGEFDGQIVIDGGDDYKFELELNGVKLYNNEQNPVTVLSGDKVTLTAKKGTKNYIYDTRAALSEGDETSYSAAIYANCDLDLGGKGELIVISSENNGIHTKDDLKVKNLTLSVTCRDNALKGNDSVTVTSGILTLIAKAGDGIKTTNTDISSKGNQRGIVTISGGTLDIYAACDGIDAAYNVVISDEATVNIYTERYSPYSETVETATSETSAYSSFNGGFGGGNQGRPGNLVNPGGGMNDGNTEKSEYSTKGIKAGNEVDISGGVITVNAYDDAIHANGGETLENAETSTGNVTLSGGTLALFSKDDGVHADGTLTVSGGKIVISGCYEGLEGEFVSISGGDVSIVSSDDGINATTTSGTGITFGGGKVYVYAGGDGVDSNSKTQYGGILFAGGEITIVSTSGGDSSIDTENGYTYTGGTVLALSPSGGMASEATNCKNFSSVATKTIMNLSQGQTVSVKVGGEAVLSVEMPCRLSALIVYLGSANATFSAE